MGAGLPERQHLPFRTRVHHLTQWESSPELNSGFNAYGYCRCYHKIIDRDRRIPEKEVRQRTGFR